MSNEAKARKLDQRHRDLCVLADDEGTTDAESDTARRLARRIAKKIRALGWEPGALPPLVDAETSIPGFEHLDPSPPRPAVPTIEVHGQRGPGGARRAPYKIAAPYWCPRCGHGRVTPYCALCERPAEETPRGILGDVPDGWS